MAITATLFSDRRQVVTTSSRGSTRSVVTVVAVMSRDVESDRQWEGGRARARGGQKERGIL